MPVDAYSEAIMTCHNFKQYIFSKCQTQQLSFRILGLCESVLLFCIVCAQRTTTKICYLQHLAANYFLQESVSTA